MRRWLLNVLGLTLHSDYDSACVTIDRQSNEITELYRQIDTLRHDHETLGRASEMLKTGPDWIIKIFKGLGTPTDVDRDDKTGVATLTYGEDIVVTLDTRTGDVKVRDLGRKVPAMKPIKARNGTVNPGQVAALQHFYVDVLASRLPTGDPTIGTVNLYAPASKMTTDVSTVIDEDSQSRTGMAAALGS